MKRKEVQRGLYKRVTVTTTADEWRQESAEGRDVLEKYVEEAEQYAAEILAEVGIEVDKLFEPVDVPAEGIQGVEAIMALPRCKNRGLSAGPTRVAWRVVLIDRDGLAPEVDQAIDVAWSVWKIRQSGDLLGKETRNALDRGIEFAQSVEQLKANRAWRIPLEAWRRQRDNVSQRNARQAVTPEERARVEELNEALFSEWPKKIMRYEEVARQLDLKPDRVRYILDGPRRTRKQ